MPANGYPPDVGAWIALALLAGGYAWRARLLSWQRLGAFAAGLGLLAAALWLPDRLFWAHMTQHLLLGDLAPLYVLAGVTGRALRLLLALRPVRALRVLAHPAAALPLWAVNLAVWHLPPVYDAAYRHDWLHGVQHASFFAAGLAVWAPIVEALPGPAWFGAGARLGYVLAVRVVGMALGTVFVFAGPLYSVYPSADAQRAAGGVMLLEGSIVTVAAFAWFFLRAFREHEARERLIESGTPPTRAARAVRYGRAGSP